VGLTRKPDRTLVFGAGSTLASEAIGRGAAMMFQLVVANQLGAAQFGLVALALASAAMLSPFADAGLPNLALRTVSGAPEDNRLVHRLFGLKCLFTPLYLLPLLLWTFCFHDSGDLRWSLVWAGAFYGFQASSDLLRQILRARQETTRELMARFAYPVGNLLALVLVWKLRPGPTGALLALASGPFALTLSYWLAFPKGARGGEFGNSAILLARQNAGLLIQSVAYLVFVGLATRVDAFILEKHAGRIEVGRYFAAMNLVTAGGFFGQGLSAYLYPRLHRQVQQRGRALLRASAVQAALGACLFAGVLLAGPFVFQVVFKTSSFQGAQALLPGLGATLGFATLDWLWLSVLIGSNRTWIAALNLVPVLASKLFLAPFLIASHGAQGMVWASLAGQILTCLAGAATAYMYFVRRAPNA
jgi:O-antigen/teichoic acid export membrane protein